jgi:PmbA protein
MMDIRDFKTKLFEVADKAGFTECEIYLKIGESFNVSAYKGKLEKYSNSSTGGFCFRGLYNGNMGYSYSESIDYALIDKIVDDAKQNAEIITTEDKEFIYKGDENYTEVNVYNKELTAVKYDTLLNMAIETEKAAYEYNKRITGVNKSMVGISESKVYIANTKGLELEEKENYILAYCEVMGGENDAVKEKGEICIGRKLSDIDPKTIGSNAAKKVIESLGGESVKSGKTAVIIQNEAMADILECFSSNFYAENAQKGFSLLKDKTGDKIAADIITIADEPLLENGMTTTSFDSEGVAAYNKNVIENGVLKTLLYNLKSANKDGVKSTGNGFKYSFKGTISTAVTNFYIKGGNISYDELISKLGSGIIITDVQGLHAGANAITGDFSLAAEGFLVENGKITRPVEQITVAGNFYDILLGITTLSSDLKFNSSGIGSPSVMLNEMSVSGL